MFRVSGVHRGLGFRGAKASVAPGKANTLAPANGLEHHFFKKLTGGGKVGATVDTQTLNPRPIK